MQLDYFTAVRKSETVSVSFADEVFQSFKKFGDSLLTRSGKLEDLASAVESYLSELEDGSNDVKRITKCCGCILLFHAQLLTSCMNMQGRT